MPLVWSGGRCFDCFRRSGYPWNGQRPCWLFRELGLRQFIDHCLLGMQGHRLRGGVIREEGLYAKLLSVSQTNRLSMPVLESR